MHVKCDNPECYKKVEVSETDFKVFTNCFCSLECVEKWETINGLVNSDSRKVVYKDYGKNQYQDVTFSRLARK